MRTAIIVCTLLYLIFSSGIKVNAHYCGGELQSVSVLDFQKDCKKCGKKQMKGCCKDVSSTFQLSDSNSFKQCSFQAKGPIVESFFFSFQSYPTFLVLTQIIEVNQSNAPPCDPSKPIYLRNRTFIV